MELERLPHEFFLATTELQHQCVEQILIIALQRRDQFATFLERLFQLRLDDRPLFVVEIGVESFEQLGDMSASVTQVGRLDLQVKQLAPHVGHLGATLTNAIAMLVDVGQFFRVTLQSRPIESVQSPASRTCLNRS